MHSTMGIFRLVLCVFKKTTNILLPLKIVYFFILFYLYQIQCIHDACERAKQAKTDNFEVHILLDHTRGSRGGDKSSRAMLLPLVQQYGSRVQVYLYHTPDLRGWLKKLVPERFDETVGLTHMKIYLVDDDFIISG